VRLWGLFETPFGPVAVAGESILQVLEKPDCHSLPLGPSVADGVFLFRGEWAVALKFECLATEKNIHVVESAYMVLLSSDSGPVGLPVDRVVTIARLQAQVLQVEEIESFPLGCVGVIEENGRGFAVIDIDHLLADLAKQQTA